MTDGNRTPRTSDPRLATLVEALDRAFDRRGWHGTTLLGSLRGVTPEIALLRPGPDRHSIWELVLHTAYWKYAVRRRLAGDEKGSFPRRPSDWPDVPDEPTPAALRADIALLREEHAQLRRTVLGLSPDELDAPSPSGTWTNLEQILGVAAHDAYHTGQIQLVKRIVAGGD